jgi:fructuronate reductase
MAASSSTDAAPRLAAATLPLLPIGVDAPRYTRPAEGFGVVHLGLGAFHRAHQAMVFDHLLRQGDPRWGVFGVAMRSTELAGALAAQDGLYAVQVASESGIQWAVPGAVFATAVAALERERVVAALAAAGTRWLTLTVTEKGYAPELAQLIVEGLAARHAAGRAGLTIASCDNLRGNGKRLEALCLAAARERDGALAGWIEKHCVFPDSMVDRIVPASTSEQLAAAQAALGLHDAAALGTEAFWEWVIEDHFADPTDAQVLRQAGVRITHDVAAYEDAKLRMLNGSHTAMACIGAVAGLSHVADCVAQPEVRRFVHGLMTHEIAPHLARRDWPEYRDALLQRFANPQLRHRVHQIAMDCSQKIPQRWPASITAQLRSGLAAERFAFAAAAWMRYCLGRDERGNEYALSDPMAADLQALARQHAGDPKATAAALGTIAPIWGDELPVRPDWLQRVTHWLDRINTQGLLAALATLNRETA